MSEENMVMIPSGSVLTREQTNTLHELAKTPIDIDEETLDKFNSVGCPSFVVAWEQKREKPIKVVFDSGVQVTSEEDKFQMNMGLLYKICEHNLGALDCSDMSDEEIEKIVNEFNSICGA